jgi:hypothetical protein
MVSIVDGCCLIEERVLEFMRLVGLTRNGTYIDQAGLRHSVDTGIGGQAVSIAGRTLVSAIDEYNAAVAAQLSWYKWRNCGYTIEFMEEVVAYNRLHRLIELHSNDAQQTEAARIANRK